MSKNNRSVPEGTRDIIFSEAKLEREISERLADVFEAAGFSEIRTPAVEYYDVFDYPGQAISQDEMYKLTDSSGNLIVMRADNTTPVARIAATRLQSERLPLMIRYCQNVWRISRGYSGRRSEILQSGAEHIGAGGMKGDLICLSLALDALRSLGAEYKLELGCVGYYDALIRSLPLTDEEKSEVRRYVDAKNTVKLAAIGRKLRGSDASKGFDRIRRLPLLYGGGEVFKEAEALAHDNEDALGALAYLRGLYDALCSAGFGDRVIIDLGMVHSIDYYTGTLFAGYIEGAGEPVLRGGRYDNLIDNFGRENIPAIGFAINVSLAADALRSGADAETAPDVIIHFGGDDIKEALKQADMLRRDGLCAALSCFDTPAQTLEYARERGINNTIIIENGDARTVEAGKGAE